MDEVLLLNPRRRKARRAKSHSAAAPRRRRARRRNPVALAAPRRVSRRRNPIANLGRHRRRRRNPITLRRVTRRRRNPISLGGVSAKGIISQFKDAVIGGAGSLVVDVLMGKVNAYLPASLQTTQSVGVGDAVKAVLTCILGSVLSKPTRGLSRKMAAGALVVQARDIMSAYVPASLGLGYASPARIVGANARVGPNVRNMRSMAAYVRPGASPLLAAYSRPGSPSPLLNGGASLPRMSTAAGREGVRYR